MSDQTMMVDFDAIQNSEAQNSDLVPRNTNDTANEEKSEVKLTEVARMPMAKAKDYPPVGSKMQKTGIVNARCKKELTNEDVLADRFEIRQRLGEGGMGVVYAAFDRLREEEIAIKVMRPHLVQNSAARERFVNEARIASSLTHPSIVRVFDIQEASSHTFMTMELLKGCNLRQEIQARTRRNQQFSMSEIISIGVQLCEVLQHAHSITIHRDIKPENIWMCNDGTIKLMDFGIARMMRPCQFAETGISMGTAYYMAPEQFRADKDIDHRADQYSTGVVLYELLTGELPQGAVRAPSDFKRKVPQQISKTVMKCLSGKPDARHADMKKLQSALKSGNGLIGFGSITSIYRSVFSAIQARQPSRPRRPVKKVMPDKIGDQLNAAQEAANEAQSRSTKKLEELAGFDCPTPTELNQGKDLMVKAEQTVRRRKRKQAIKLFKSANATFEQATNSIDHWITEKFTSQLQVAGNAIARVGEIEQQANSLLINAKDQLSKSTIAGFKPKIKAAQLALKDLEPLCNTLEGRTTQKDNLQELLENIISVSPDNYAANLRELESIATEADCYHDQIRKLMIEREQKFSDRLLRSRIALTSRQYDKAIELNPMCVDAYLNRGIIWSKRKNHEKAVKDYNRSIQIDPVNAKAYNNRGVAYGELGKTESAIADYSQAIELNPKYYKAFNNRGNAFIDAGKYKSAVEDYGTAIALNQRRALAYNNRGFAYHVLGMCELAIQDLETAIKLDPEYKIAIQNLRDSKAELQKTKSRANNNDSKDEHGLPTSQSEPNEFSNPPSVNQQELNPALEKTVALHLSQDLEDHDLASLADEFDGALPQAICSTPFKWRGEQDY